MLNRAVGTHSWYPLLATYLLHLWRNLNACGATQPSDRSESDEPTSPPICRSSPGSLTSLQSSHRILHSACVVSAGAPWRKFGCATMLLQGPQPSTLFLDISCVPENFFMSANSKTVQIASTSVTQSSCCSGGLSCSFG